MPTHVPSSQPFLRLDQLVKRFGGQTAVDHLSLDIEQGEFISLLGPSGGGKTTTLHMIAGFIQPDAGEILVDGIPIGRLPSHQRGAAMVFQSYALFPHMTVFDNVAFGLRMRKCTATEIRRRVGEALAMVRLDGLEQRYPRALSGGQQQRVALARAIVLAPRLLLLDEPLSNLDPGLRAELRQNALDIHRLTGMTTLLVTHDLEEAFTTSDRVAILGHGRLQQFDTPRQLYTLPANRFVADFVGHRNIIAGSIESRHGQAMLRPAGTRVLLPLPTGAQHHGDTALFVIPAHALTLHRDNRQAPAPGCHRLPARLVRQRYLGSQLAFEADLGGLHLSGENAFHPGIDALTDGSAIYLDIRSDDLIALPAQA